MPIGRKANHQTHNFDETLIDGSRVRLKQTVFNVDDDYLHDLDRIASYFLACVFSAIHKRTVKRQSYANADTVAVARRGESLYFFANTLFSDTDRRPFEPVSKARREGGANAAFDTIFEALDEAGIDDIEDMSYVFKTSLLSNRAFHAEMKLVQYFYEKGMPIDGSYIGVSKPCCQTCAAKLDALGIGYAYWHAASGNVDWQPPSPQSRWY